MLNAREPNKNKSLDKKAAVEPAAFFMRIFAKLEKDVLEKWLAYAGRWMEVKDLRRRWLNEMRTKELAQTQYILAASFWMINVQRLRAQREAEDALMSWDLL